MSLDALRKTSTNTVAMKHLANGLWRDMKLRSLAPASVILALSLIATALYSNLARRDAERAAQQRFDGEVREIRDTVGDALRTYAQLLRGGVGFVRSSPKPTREAWRTYVDALAADRLFPGIQGIGYSVVIPPDDLVRHEAEQRAGGNPEYRVVPSGDRPLYTAIVWLEPDNWRNRRAIGFDMFSEPARRAAMARARNTGEPSLSGKVILVQETGENQQAGALLYMPVYASAEETPLPHEREQMLKGFVYAAFRISDLMERLLPAQLPGSDRRLRIEVFDGLTTDPQALYFDSIGSALRSSRAPAFTEETRVEIHGATWTLRISSLPNVEMAVASGGHLAVLGVGALLSLLMTAIVASLALARDRSIAAEQLISSEMEQRLRAQEQVQIANQELVHRVKNLLTVVSAIASQTARHSPNLQSFSKSFAQRLGALGRVHDLLRADTAASADLKTLVRDVLSPYCADRPDAMILDGQAVDVPQKDAMLLSLLVNELATNATKYGAWSVPGGRVEMSWRMATIDDKPNLILRWSEMNGPLVKPPSRTGFGSNVMRFAVERSMGGELDLKYEPSGVRHELRIPWSGIT